MCVQSDDGVERQQGIEVPCAKPELEKADPRDSRGT
jgi:hypothetical protein